MPADSPDALDALDAFDKAPSKSSSKMNIAQKGTKQAKKQKSK